MDKKKMMGKRRVTFRRTITATVLINPEGDGWEVPKTMGKAKIEFDKWTKTKCDAFNFSWKTSKIEVIEG